MILINKKEAQLLRENGYESFINVANRTHKSSRKTYYVAEEDSIMKLLEAYRNSNLAN